MIFPLRDFTDAENAWATVLSEKQQVTEQSKQPDDKSHINENHSHRKKKDWKKRTQMLWCVDVAMSDGGVE